jgi:hypothetical protein
MIPESIHRVCPPVALPSIGESGALATHMRTALALEALETAIWTRHRHGVADLAGLRASSRTETDGTAL